MEGRPAFGRVIGNHEIREKPNPCVSVGTRIGFNQAGRRAPLRLVRWLVVVVIVVSCQLSVMGLGAIRLRPTSARQVGANPEGSMSLHYIKGSVRPPDR